MKNLGRVFQGQAIFFNCDIQTGFAKHVFGMQSVENTAVQMAKTAKILNIPVFVTEQNTKTFGNTLDSIKQNLVEDSKYFEKTSFSMLNEETKEYLSQYPERKQVILYGLETHVCVQQTCLDLLEENYDVHLLVDGISSIKDIDRKAGLQRMINAGAFVTTSQSIIFELLKDHTHPEFKSILKEVLKLPRDDSLTNF